MSNELLIVENLQTKFKLLLNSAIPVEEILDSTFLEISGFPHYEEVISNWYAFFLKANGSHNFKTLFISSLIECYEAKAQIGPVVFFIEKTTVIREHMIADGKRIDLLVYDQLTERGINESYSNVFIVENKINATLYNELDVYHNSIKADNKYGIVLTLNPINVATTNFINITHQALMDRVAANIGKYIVKANPKYLLLLKEFIQQIQSFNKTINMKDTVDFYFENAVKINELIKIKEKALDSIVEGIRLKLEGTDFLWGRKYPEAINIRYKKDEKILLTIDTSLIFTEGRYNISLWLSGEFARSWKDKKEQLSLMVSKPVDIAFNQSSTGAQYAFIASEKVSFGLSKENIEKLPDLILNHLQSYWSAFLNELVGVFVSKNNVM